MGGTMKYLRFPFTMRWIAIACLFAVFLLPRLAHAANDTSVIRDWKVQWIPEQAVSEPVPSSTRPWIESGADRPFTILPEGMRGMWVRFTVPPTAGLQRPGLLVDRLYGLDLSVYEDNKLLYESKRDFIFDLNKLLVPIDQYAVPKEIYVRILSSTERVGFISSVHVGNFEALSKRFLLKDMPDLLLGTSIVLLSLMMLLCSGFLHRKQRSSWISLCLIALTMGTIIIAYSPLPYIYFRPFGKFLLLLFDLSLFIMVPAINYYVDQVFEGQFRLFTKFRHWQAGYCLLCMICLIVYLAAGNRFYSVYYVLTTAILGAFILVQLVFIILLSVLYAKKGNKNAVLLSCGIVFLALMGTVDLILYFLTDKRYVLYLWKFGIIGMMMALVLILARRISADYGKLLNYSKELELYNYNLQRTEKLKIISDLAASVAHEVRNPLQVTRGFLQLLAGRADEKNKPYFDLASNELDRASDIITDFLTFAKPEIDTIRLLNISEELKKIEAMMMPMVAMHGGILHFSSQDNLYFYGNSSKLKQALINIIKNSIEAIKPDGRIEVKAQSEHDQVVVQITDNGVGMDEEEVSKLGVPFFSTKSKGTGLGLMVTFRIIEVMNGTIKIRSAKGKGTEFTIRFPQVYQDEILPDGISL